MFEPFNEKLMAGIKLNIRNFSMTDKVSRGRQIGFAQKVNLTLQQRLRRPM